jgi:hypothetical protein
LEGATVGVVASFAAAAVETAYRGFLSNHIDFS